MRFASAARSRWCIAAALLLVACLGARAQVSDYPDKPITLVVPYAPGSATDVSARIVAERMAVDLGKPILIDNRAGAGGNLGSNLVARSAPDGYRLVIGTIGSHAINVSLTPNMPYDAQRDFVPISLLTINPILIVVNKSLPVKNIAELIEYSKAQPGGLAYGSAGIGSGPHLAGEMLRVRTGAKLIHVPYKNAGQGITDVIAGTLPMLIYPMPPLLPHLSSGALRAIAVTSGHRVPQLPGLATTGEQGLNDFIVDGWNALLAPAGLPKPILERLYGAVRVAMTDPEVQKKLISNGLVPVGNSPDEFKKFLDTEIAGWRKVIQATGVKAE